MFYEWGHDQLVFFPHDVYILSNVRIEEKNRVASQSMESRSSHAQMLKRVYSPIHGVPCSQVFPGIEIYDEMMMRVALAEWESEVRREKRTETTMT